MSFLRWPKLSVGTPLPDVVAAVNRWMAGNPNVAVGGERATTALDSDGALVTDVKGSATIAGKGAGIVAATYSAAFTETFETVPADWTRIAGTVDQTVVATGQTGGKALRQVGTVTQAFPADWRPLPFDQSKLYRLRARVKRISGTGTFSYGLRAYDAADAYLGSVAACAFAATPGAGYTEYTGWCRGIGSAVQPATNPLGPSGLPTGTVAVRPYYVLNGGDATGVMDLDLIDFDRQDEEAHARVYDTLLPSGDPARGTGAGLYPDTVDTAAIQLGAVIADRITVTDLAAINATLGSVTTGFIQDPSGSFYLNLLNNGGNVLVVPGLVVTPTTATFSGTVAATTFTASLATFVNIEAASYNTSAGGPYQVQGNGFGGASYALRMGGAAGASYVQAGTGHSLTLGGPAGIALGNNTTVFGNLTVTGTITPSFSPAPQTITGSRGGNTALTSLIAAVCTAFGWTDSTTP